MTGHHVTPEDGGVVRVGILAPLALGDSFPVVIEDVLVRPDLHGGQGLLSSPCRVSRAIAKERKNVPAKMAVIKSVLFWF